MDAKLPKGVTRLSNGKFRVQIRRTGFERFDRVCDTRDEAISVHKNELQRRKEISEGDDVTMTLSAAAARYLESSIYKNKKEKTRYEEKLHLNPVVEHLGHHSLIDIAKNPRVLTRYRDMRLRTKSLRNPDKNIGAAKVRCEIAALSSIFLWAVDEQLFTTNPIVGIKRGSSPQRKRRLEPKEEATLMLLANSGKEEWVKEIARFLLLGREFGSRVGELADVMVEDINLFEHDLTFRDTKSGEDRRIHLTPVAVDLIGEQMVCALAHNQQRLFCSYKRRVKGATKVEERSYNYQTWVNKLKEGGLVGSDFIAYAVRKEFVTSGIERGVDIGTLQLMTGHKTLQALERYKVHAKMTKKTRTIFDDLSEEQQLESMEKTIAALPPETRELFLERLKSSNSKANESDKNKGN